MSQKSDITFLYVDFSCPKTLKNMSMRHTIELDGIFLLAQWNVFIVFWKTIEDQWSRRVNTRQGSSWLRLKTTGGSFGLTLSWSQMPIQGKITVESSSPAGMDTAQQGSGEVAHCLESREPPFQHYGSTQHSKSDGDMSGGISPAGMDKLERKKELQQ